jgi:hypothetical protein
MVVVVVFEVEMKKAGLYILVVDKEGDEQTVHARSGVQQWPVMLHMEQWQSSATLNESNVFQNSR